MPDAADLDLMALMASRICHDLISPVGAIANGIEILTEESGPDGDPAMRAQALDLIAQSAESAARRLTFCRMAFGAAGGAGAVLDAGEVCRVASDLLAGGKASLEWPAASGTVPRNVGKVALILIALAADCLSRGGVIRVETTGDGASSGKTAGRISVKAVAERHTVSPNLQAGLAGTLPIAMVDAKLAPAVYAGILSRLDGGWVKLEEGGGSVDLSALVYA